MGIASQRFIKILHYKKDNQIIATNFSNPKARANCIPSAGTENIGLTDSGPLPAMLEVFERFGKARAKGATTMATKRKALMITSAKKPTSPLPDALKQELEAKASDLVANVLKPKHVRPPQEDERFNYITDIGTKWYRRYFYFVSIYACPDSNALSRTFEEKFARMEYIGDSKFALYFMRHTGEWVGIHDALSVDESMKAIQDDSWFTP